MDTDTPDSGTGLGFYLRRFALVVFVLLASRGALEIVSGGNQLVGVAVVILGSIIGGWLLLRYEDAYHKE